MNFVFMLTQPDFNLTFLFLPCGFLSLPCSVSSLGFMSYMLIILPGLGSSIIWAPGDGWMGVCPPHPTPHSPQQSAGTGCWLGLDLLGKGEEGNGMPIPLHHPGSGSPLSTQHFLKKHKKIPPKSGVRMGCWELQKTAAVSENHQELALLITGFGELPRTLQ